MRVFALLALAACTNAAVRVRPADLALHAQELSRTGEADVPFEGTNVHVKATERVDVRIADGDTQHLEHLTIGELVKGCETDPDAKTCLANQALRDPILVRRERHANHDKLETGIAFGAMGAAVGTCLAMCQSDPDLGRGFAYIGGAVAIMMGAFVLLVALGGHD